MVTCEVLCGFIFEPSFFLVYAMLIILEIIFVDHISYTIDATYKYVYVHVHVYVYVYICACCVCV